MMKNKTKLDRALTDNKRERNRNANYLKMM